MITVEQIADACEWNDPFEIVSSDGTLWNDTSIATINESRSEQRPVSVPPILIVVRNPHQVLNLVDTFNVLNLMT